ncbi:MAG: 3-phosphoglycerate dehydrogenase [Clostridiales Family XIII bacterium]|jgi:D-3-phosphoglycerate dehydrogenase|nr:3-phosphoglycerate dehydrogenase [Clostridiales Family XIII bacterium]
MYKIATLNRISPKGLNLLTEQYELTNAPERSEAILVRSQDLREMEFSQELLAIARAGAGVNNIPVDRCSEAGVVVFNTPGANANAVKELVLTALFMASRNIIDALEWTKTLKKDAAAIVEKQKSKFAGEEIAGKRLAVIGLGYIGVMVANAAKGLGMKVVGYDPYISVQNAHDLSPSVKIYDSLESLLPHCDFVTIHVPATEQTKGMFSYKLLDAMKNKAVLLNFARDSLVNAEDVKRALDERKLRLYVTDFPTDALLGTENALLIPHLGASTRESEENCAIMAVEQVMNYLEQGVIENSVNFPTCTPGPKITATRVCVLNKNIPSMLGKLTGVLAEMNLNISKLINKSKGDNAYTVIDVDGDVDAENIKNAFRFEGIISVRII